MRILIVLASANRCMYTPEGGAVGEASWVKIHFYASDTDRALPSGQTRLLM